MQKDGVTGEEKPLLAKAISGTYLHREVQKSVFIIGIRGAGKKTRGGWTSRILGWPFIDMDTELEKQEGRSIPEMLKDNDWESFRRKETLLHKRLMKEEPEGCVLAAGGGIVETPECRSFLKDWQNEGMVLYATRDVKAIMDFLHVDKDPPAYVEDVFGVYLRRKPRYEERSNINT